MIGLLLLLFFIMYRRQRVSSQYKLVENCLRDLKRDEVTSVIIPDGIGGLLEIERLVLTDHGLLLMETYQISGHLFGSEHIDQWTQIIDGRSFKFANPLRHIHNAKYAVQLLAPKIPIFCSVVFTADSDFPKGKPVEVSTLKSLEYDLQVVHRAPRVAQVSQKAWQQILRIARKDDLPVAEVKR